MRRPMLIIFVVILLFSLIYTNKQSDYALKNDNEIEGIVTYIQTKDKYTSYDVGNYLVNDYSRGIKFEVGEKVSIKGKSKDLNDLIYEDFNYGRYLKSKGYKGLIYLDTYDKIGENFLYLKIGEVRDYVYNNLLYLYKDKSAFINSLIMGIKSDLTPHEQDMFSKTGTSHIIAISGLHIGIISCIMILFIGKINKVHKLILLMIGISMYYLIVGNLVSVQRAILFSLVSYISFFIDRRVDGISTISTIGTIMVINNPYIIYNLSFQLSFLATLSIIYFYDHIKGIVKFDILAITISANILTIPLIYYHFNIISIVSLVSNIITMLIIGPIMCIAIASLCMFKVDVYISKIISSVAIDIIEVMYVILEKMSRFEFAYIKIKNPKVHYVIIYYIAILGFMIYNEMITIKEQEHELQGYYD